MGYIYIYNITETVLPPTCFIRQSVPVHNWKMIFSNRFYKTIFVIVFQKKEIHLKNLKAYNGKNDFFL